MLHGTFIRQRPTQFLDKTRGNNAVISLKLNFKLCKWFNDAQNTFGKYEQNRFSVRKNILYTACFKDIT